MKKKQFKMTRRQVLKAGMIGGAGMMLPLRFLPRKAFGEAAAAGLSDPALQPKFVNIAPNALHPAFKFMPNPINGRYGVEISGTTQWTGLMNPRNGRRLLTDVWGYGDERGPTWPGRTFEVLRDSTETTVRWDNKLRAKQHLLPVDTNLHWCYALHGASSANGVDYRQYSIKHNGVPIITHVHGGHSDFQYDGNPEFFYSPDGDVKGPQWTFAPNGFETDFKYDNDVPAGNLWYHDHALGLTRLNVYAGLAGFYFVRDEYDTGGIGPQTDDLGLPKFPYELAYAIQDRMFTDAGKLFYPAFPGDPFYEGFITDEGAILPPDLFPGGGPTALAEFFGDHMVVNGLIWPKEDVRPRNYRLRLLNGTDSRFMGIRFRVASSPTATDLNGASDPLNFKVIGSDQGLASEATETNLLLFEPGSRYDIIFDFRGYQGDRIIMENIGGDAPFGGELFGDLTPSEIDDAVEAGDLFPDRQTDRIMAFDVADVPDEGGDIDYDGIDFGPTLGPRNRPVRKVALFEGLDEFGRLQPLLGTADPDNPDPTSGSEATPYTWFQPTTETPDYDSTEEWEIYNFTGDAHPIHLHLVNFEILGRQEISFTETFDPDGTAGTDYQEVLQHNGSKGKAAIITNIVPGIDVDLTPSDGYVENAPKDMVTALPEQVTKIKAHFDKTGRYVWHCHILSHEDHEMMRVLEVVES